MISYYYRHSPAKLTDKHWNLNWPPGGYTRFYLRLAKQPNSESVSRTRSVGRISMLKQKANNMNKQEVNTKLSTSYLLDPLQTWKLLRHNKKSHSKSQESTYTRFSIWKFSRHHRYHQLMIISFSSEKWLTMMHTQSLPGSLFTFTKRAWGRG